MAVTWVEVHLFYHFSCWVILVLLSSAVYIFHKIISGMLHVDKEWAKCIEVKGGHI